MWRGMGHFLRGPWVWGLAAVSAGAGAALALTLGAGMFAPVPIPSTVLSRGSPDNRDASAVDLPLDQ